MLLFLTAFVGLWYAPIQIIGKHPTHPNKHILDSFTQTSLPNKHIVPKHCPEHTVT
jgi:hypothetical protein